VTTTIFLLRHGSHDRLNRILCGRMPGVSLSERGRAEARGAAERFAREALTALYASPLERTLETAELVAAATGLPIITDPDLIEVDYGEWTGRPFGELYADPHWQAWDQARGAGRPPGGESLFEVQQRMRRFLDRVLERHPGQRVLAVSHGDPIKSILAHATGMPLDKLDRLEIGPASTSVLTEGEWGLQVFGMNEPPKLARGAESAD
jgi:probable phosphoglycerate mutase